MAEATSGGREWVLADEDATSALATRVAINLDEGLVIYLHGPLGAGKTSFARALLTAFGVGERVKSRPTALSRAIAPAVVRRGTSTFTGSPTRVSSSGWAWTRSATRRPWCLWNGPNAAMARCRLRHGLAPVLRRRRAPGPRRGRDPPWTTGVAPTLGALSRQAQDPEFD